jgi:hypothetical protein
VLANGLEERVAPGLACERRAGGEREDLEHVAMHAVARRRVGRQPRRLQVGVAPDAEPVAVLVAARQRPFRQGAVARRQADDDRVHQGLRRGRVGVLDDHDDRTGGFGNAGPLQRRRVAVAVVGVALGDRRVVGERQAADANRGHASAQVDGVEGGLVEPGTLSAQDMADHVGKFFEHGSLRRPGIRRGIRHALPLVCFLQFLY